MGVVKKTVQQSIGVSWLVLSRVIGLTLLVVLINWIYVIYYTSFAIKNCSGVLDTVVIVLWLLLFVLIVPILGFFVAKVYAIKRAIAYLFDHNKAYILDLFAEQFSKNYEKGKWSQKSLNKSQVLNQWIGKLPLGMGWLVRVIMDELPILPAFQKTADDIDVYQTPPNEVATLFTKNLDANIKDVIIDASLTTWLIFIAFDVLLMWLFVHFWL